MIKYLILLLLPFYAYAHPLKPKLWSLITPMDKYEDEKIYHYKLDNKKNCLIGKAPEDGVVLVILQKKESYEILLFSTIYHIKYYCPEEYYPVITLFNGNEIIISEVVMNNKFHNMNDKSVLSVLNNINKFRIDYVFKKDLK